jgi:hypothetical protein
MTRILFSALAGLLAAHSALATDIILPLDSFRSQGSTDHCWAYSASHFIEALSQSETGVSTTLDTERDLRYWVLYDRFLQRYKTGHEMEDTFADDELTNESGFPEEFFTAFLEHGKPVISTGTASRKAAYAFPDTPSGNQGFFWAPRGNGPDLDAEKLLKALKGASDSSQASELIRSALDASSDALSAGSTALWQGQPVAYVDLPRQMLPGHLNQLQDDPLVQVETVTEDAENLHHWESFLGGKYLSYYATLDEMEKIARFSLEHGFPLMEFNEDHVWVITGVHENAFIRADSIQDSIYWSTASIGGQRTGGVVALKSIVTGVIPQPQTLDGRELEIPSRKTRIHRFR